MNVTTCYSEYCHDGDDYCIHYLKKGYQAPTSLRCLVFCEHICVQQQDMSQVSLYQYAAAMLQKSPSEGLDPSAWTLE